MRSSAVGLLRLVPSTSPVRGTVRRLVAVQAQDFPGAVTSVALRTEGRQRDDVLRALDEGTVVPGRVGHMAAVSTLVVVVTLGMLITRVATVALTMTGMTLQHARFQARSALTGTGFTTSEAEAVVDHPARRKIVMVLMLVGGAGAVSVIGTLILSFAGVDSTGGGLQRAAVIVLALAVLLWLAGNDVVGRALRRVIERALRNYSDLDVRDYAALLHLRGRWRVVQLPVEEDDWIAARPLGRLRLPEEGVTVLGVERDGTWIGAPPEDLQVQVDDVVVLYGREAMLEAIAGRLHGEEGDAASEQSRAWHAATPPVESIERVRR